MDSKGFKQMSIVMLVLGMIFMFFSIVWGLGYLAFSIFIFLFALYKQEEERKKSLEEQIIRDKEAEQKRKDEEAKRLQELPKNIYADCKTRGVTMIASPRDGEILRLIAQNHQIWDENEARKLFEEGRRIEMAADNKREQDKFREDKKRAQLVGKEKYLGDLPQQRDKLEQQVEAERKLRAAALDLGYAQMRTTAKKSDWAIAGGIAQGLAGSAAGLAVAADTQRKNAEAERRAAQTREEGKALVDATMNSSSNSILEASRVRIKIKKINDKMIDQTDEDKKFETIDLSIKKYEVLPTGNMSIEISSSTKTVPQIAGIDAMLDGAILVTVCCDEKEVGVAYYAPNITSVSKSYGFHSDRTNLIACSYAESFAAEKTYTFKFSPIHLWTIEA